MSLSFFGIGMKTDLFQWVTAEFSKFADILSVALPQHHLLGWAQGNIGARPLLASAKTKKELEELLKSNTRDGS